jgi:phosphoribosylaminoimidazole-succinocarboxamide synthase
MSNLNTPLLYQGSVKDVRGPLRSKGPGQGCPAVIFDYTDAYSVFDWGKMPDLLPHKGESLSIIAADWFEKIENPETWKEFSKSPGALSLRKGNRFGASFNELGEVLQQQGIRTHYLGVVSSPAAVTESEVIVQSIRDLGTPFKHIAVKPVAVVKPTVVQVMGRSVSDYTQTRQAQAPRLIPLEVVFRFSCPAGSSLIDRARLDPDYLTSIGYNGLKVGAGEKWDFPVVELFTKLESTDRLLTLSEGLAISGLTAEQLQEVLFKTAWVAGWIKSVCAKKNLELADGKLEWAVGEKGDLILVDAIGPDELRIMSHSSAGSSASPGDESVQLSKEFLRTFYRPTPWYARVNRAKQEAQVKGASDWKRGVSEGPPPLTPQVRELGSQLYQSLANELTGRVWFTGAWPLSKVIQELKAFQRGGLSI